MPVDIDLDDISSLSPDEIAKLSNDSFAKVMQKLVEIADRDRQEWQIKYYRPASDRCMIGHESKARLLGLFGGNGCLPLDAPVLMADGSWKPLGEIVVGDMVIAADPDTGLAVPAPVTTVWRSGRKPLYRIDFSDGGWFEATAEHMVPMLLGSGRLTSKGKPKRAKKRRLGDYIEPILRRGAANPSKRISCVSPRDIQFSSRRPGMSPYLLGALLGDGSLGARSLKFSNADERVIERVGREIDAAGGRLVKYQGYDFGVCGRRWRDSPVRDAVRALGLWGANSYSKFIPKECFGWSRAERLELLAGLVDTDGGLNSYSSCSSRLAHDFAALVRSVGGKATIGARTSRCQNGVDVAYFGVYWRIGERLPLSCPEKQAEDCAGRPIDFTRRICRSATLSREAECGDIEVGHPAHCYVTRDFVVVSNSSKTETMLVDMIACMTGVFPDCLKHLAPQKFRGPIAARLVVESITTTLTNIIIPKLQWWKWTGLPPIGGDKGHYGWIPRRCLIDGSWERSWSAATRTLRVVCLDPENEDRALGESTLQFMAHTQDPPDFASGDFNFVGLDEPPRLAIFREIQARTMRVNGRIVLAMTWPDDPSIPVDWIFDEVYEAGRPGSPKKLEDVDLVELWTNENRNLDQNAIAAQASKWSEETRQVRLFGRPIRFSNRIHPNFTDTPSWWCFKCNRAVSVDHGHEEAA